MKMSSDLILFQAAVVDRRWADHQEQPVDQNAREGDRRTTPHCQGQNSVGSGIHVLLWTFRGR